MIIEPVRVLRLLLVLAAGAAAAGCAVSGAPQSAETSPAAARRQAPVAESREPVPPAQATPETQSASLVDSILAERRRGDFPEMEFQDFGFTITEQVRIGGDARGEYDRALSLLRQDRLREGIAVLETVIEQAPDASLPYIDLGIAYRLVGDFELAEQTLKVADALNPGNPVIHNELGIVYRQTGQFARARASYEQALGAFAEFHYARRNLAVLCDLYLADLQCALQNYRAYLDSVGSDAEVEIWVADLQNRLASQGDM